MQPVIDDTDAEEERGRDDTMAEHDDQRALDPLLVESEEARGDDRHMRDRRVSDQLLHVALRQRDEAGVDHRDHRQAKNDPHQLSRGIGERSEEHTSELQSLMLISYAVFCMKKKN